jgi:deoxyribonuclease-4
MKLKLGYSISMPLDVSSEIPEYSVEDLDIIKSMSKSFKCIQIMFSKNKISTEEIKQIKYTISNYKNIFVHASYQINMGSELLPSQTDLYNVGIDILLNEITYGIKIGMKGIILHLGKNVKNQYDPDLVYNNMVKFIIELFNKLMSRKQEINLLLETPAGQGGEMLFKIEELVEFIQRFKNQYFYSNLNICIDTCHIFQAGYDLNNDLVINSIHKILEPVKDKIKLIHLNDSFHQVGQRLDRHEQIGRGYIQTEQLIKFIFPYRNIPMILETKPPYDTQISLLN